MTEAGRRSVSRAQLSRAHPALERVSPGVGALDHAAFAALEREDAEAALDLLADLARATDPALRRQAERLAARVALRLARVGGRHARHGVGLLVARRGGDGDLDLERSLARADGTALGPEDLVLRGWAAPRRAVCLLLDRSGSMRGSQVMLAAVAAAGVVLSLREREDSAVVAFAHDAVVLRSPTVPRPADALVRDLLALRGAGATDLALALRLAGRELARTGAREGVTLLLSDAEATVGGDPLAAAGALDRLHVLGTSVTPGAVRAGRALAARGHGSYVAVRGVADLAPALRTLLG